MAEMIEPDRTIMIVSIIGLVVIWGSFFYHRYLQDGGNDTGRNPGPSDRSDGPADRSGGRTADSAQEASERQKRRTVSGSSRGRKRKR